MLLSLNRVDIKDERFLKSFTGLDWRRYLVLREVFEQIVNDYHESQRRPPEQRKRKVGGGRKSKLPGIDDKLVFVLHYHKAYPTMDNLGSTFDMSRGSACGLVHLYSRLLLQSLDKLKVLPKRILAGAEELLSYLKELGDINQLLIDVTERPHRRLRNREQRDALYSGKKSDLR